MTRDDDNPPPDWGARKPGGEPEMVILTVLVVGLLVFAIWMLLTP